MESQVSASLILVSVLGVSDGAPVMDNQTRLIVRGAGRVFYRGNS